MTNFTVDLLSAPVMLENGFAADQSCSQRVDDGHLRQVSKPPWCARAYNCRQSVASNYDCVGIATGPCIPEA